MKIQEVKNLTKDQCYELADKYSNFTEILVKYLGYKYAHHRHIAVLRSKFLGWDIEFLNPNLSRQKYARVVKVCPVCGSKFEALQGSPKEKITCSHKCGNTHFRQRGINHTNYTGNNYRMVCFHYHAKKCVVCSEDLAVVVHHFDEDKANNKPENLIPLCPTHHFYMHREHLKPIILRKVLEFIEEFKISYQK